MVGIEQAKSMVKGGHQTVGAAVTRTGKVADRQVFNNGRGVTRGGCALLRICACVMWVALVDFIVPVRIFAKIGSMALRGFLQLWGKL